MLSNKNGSESAADSPLLVQVVEDECRDHADEGEEIEQQQWRSKILDAILENFNLQPLTSLMLGVPPRALLSCLEYWAFELLVVLAGLMPTPEITTSLIAMCVNTEAITYMIAYGLSAAASTRVSNELGARNPERAKHAMIVTLKLCVVLGGVLVSALAFGHSIWAGFYSDSSVIISKFASVTPWLVISIFMDFIQGILSGVARGCGWQHLAVIINLGAYYFIGMPIAIFLGFKLKLYAMGLCNMWTVLPNLWLIVACFVCEMG